MKIIPLLLKEANNFVSNNHRHHKPVTGHRFSIGLINENILVGIAICGRPVARKTDYKKVLEVTRLCTNGTKNACSKLYGSCAKIAKEMGFEIIQTFILQSESGISLKASGWQFVCKSSGGQWKHTDKKPRKTNQPIEPKFKYQKILNVVKTTN